MKGIRMACIYSFGCPELREIKAEKFFLNFIKNPEKSQLPLIKRDLEKLEPFLFYQLINRMNSFNNPFDESIIRAYWLGNDLLQPITKRNIQKIILQGTNRRHLLKACDLIGGLPHHNFSVFWVTKKVENFYPKLMEELNDCLIKAGKVIDLKKKNLLVKTQSVILGEKEVFLEDSIEKIDFGFLSEIKKGDWISIHFGMAREEISQKSAENLLKITKEALEFFQKGA